MGQEELLISWLKLLTIFFMVSIFGLNMVVLLWWRPRKIEDHFSKQGIRGPPYRFFIGNVKELVAMMLKASSQPMPNFSHNILPRVLSFYHHWKKIYGITSLYCISHMYIFFFLFSRFDNWVLMNFGLALMNFSFLILFHFFFGVTLTIF